MRFHHNLFNLLLISVCTFVPQAQVWAEAGDWIVRLRGIGIVPDDSSSVVSLNGAGLAGTGVSVDSQPTPELDITYMFHRHWGVEVIAGTANHDVSLEGNIGPVAAGTKLFDTWVLPPTVTLQYHFLPENKFRPYVGLGVNFTTFLAEDASGALEAALGGPVNVSMSNSWGWAAQAGMDVHLRDNWFLNFDVKYIDINSTAKLRTPAGLLAVDVDIDPWVLGAGIGYRF